MLGAGLGAVFVVLILMVAGFAFLLFGGTLGLVLAGVFVLVSGRAALPDQQRDPKLHTDQHIERLITLVLVLFWNILVLLMRLNRR